MHGLANPNKMKFRSTTSYEFTVRGHHCEKCIQECCRYQIREWIQRLSVLVLANTYTLFYLSWLLN
jgi:hypothetical protein